MWLTNFAQIKIFILTGLLGLLAGIQPCRCSLVSGMRGRIDQYTIYQTSNNTSFNYIQWMEGGKSAPGGVHVCHNGEQLPAGRSQPSLYFSLSHLKNWEGSHGGSRAFDDVQWQRIGARLSESPRHITSQYGRSSGHSSPTCTDLVVPACDWLDVKPHLRPPKGGDSEIGKHFIQFRLFIHRLSYFSAQSTRHSLRNSTWKQTHRQTTLVLKKRQSICVRKCEKNSRSTTWKILWEDIGKCEHEGENYGEYEMEKSWH